MDFKVQDLGFDERGLIPAIVQDVSTHQVLMMAFMNAESLQQTLETRETWFWSRSRQELWHKGATSGNKQEVIDIQVDCDGDALLLTVAPQGPACHTGEKTCFHNQLDPAPENKTEDHQDLDATLEDLYVLLSSRYRERPPNSYTSQLFNQGIEKILAKVDEESQETIVAGRSETNQRLVEETSDLLYHLLVLLVQRGVRLAEIRTELARRRGTTRR